MRTKDEILAGAMEDIRDEKNKPDAPLWLEARKIELFVDIRDILEGILGYLAVKYEDDKKFN